MIAKIPSGPSIRRVRVVCPHNCYDTCSQIATVENGVLRRIDGDPAQRHTRGRLCAKGYSYVDRVYARDRLRHPMAQEPRGSGHWRRITWEEALGRIGRHLISLRDRYGSLLPLCLYKGSGNLGVLHTAPEALFGSMGPITEAANDLCSTTGSSAITYDFGLLQNSDPADMANARTIILWGVNPAWTAPHQMSLLLEWKDQGARLLVIDPIGSATASVADQHLQPRPGTDGALALGMARHLWETGQVNQSFLEAHTKGWGEFLQYLERSVTLDWAAAETGLPEGVIRQVADQFAAGGPSTIWIGLGLQRYRNAGQTVRAINALAALTGQIGRPGTGVQYVQQTTWVLHRALFPDGVVPANRIVSMGDLAAAIGSLEGPPVHMLWISSANPLQQGPGSDTLHRLFTEMELVVVVDQFLTRTAEEADIVLPTTTYLEQYDLNMSYWHYDVALNEQALAPLFESRSELAIAWALSRQLARLRPGFCRFPTEGDERQWLRRIWGTEAKRLFQVQTLDELRSGPRRANLPMVAWADLRFQTPSGRYEFWSDLAKAAGAPALPVYAPPVQPPDGFPIRLLTPHPADSLNSQFHGQRRVVEIHPDLANRLGLHEGQMVRLSSRAGEVRLPVRLTRTVPLDCAVVFSGAAEGDGGRLNVLTQPNSADMADSLGQRGMALADTFVAIDHDGG